MLFSDTRKIKDIQDEFSNKFKFLKIKFYKKAHTDHQGSKAGEEWNPQLTIGEVKINSKGEDFELNEKMSIQEFESQLSDSFGLNVQVFRASTNDIWLQTIATDDWTLEESNQKAANLLSEEN